MTARDLLDALDLPESARVDQRVPKTLLVAHGAPTAADKRRINDGIEEVQWLAALKPTTIGVPAFRDDRREYLEIAVLSIVLRENAKPGRLAELIHRAVPYPAVLIVTQNASIALSLAHKRWSQSEVGATVLDGELVTAQLAKGEHADDGHRFSESLPVARQPRNHLLALYQGWMDAVLALLAADVTGVYSAARSPEQATARQEALREYARLDAEIARLRTAARKEKQVARQVELNLALKRAEQRRAALRQTL